MFTLGAVIEMQNNPNRGRVIEIREHEGERHIKVYWPSDAGGSFIWYNANDDRLMLA